MDTRRFDSIGYVQVLDECFKSMRSNKKKIMTLNHKDVHNDCALFDDIGTLVHYHFGHFEKKKEKKKRSQLDKSTIEKRIGN